MTFTEKPIVEIAHNAVTAKIMGDVSKDVKIEVQKALSYYVDGFSAPTISRSGKRLFSSAAQSISRATNHSSKRFHSPSGSSWDGRSSFFRYRDSTFPRGFISLVAKHLSRQGYAVRIKRQRLPEPLGELRAKVDDFAEDRRYEFQHETVNRLLQDGQMIAQIATGGGKSRTARLCVAAIKRKTLFLTTRQLLLTQMARSFKRFKIDPKVGIISGGIWQPSPFVTCAMVQSLLSALKDPVTAASATQLLKTFEFVILEEAHESSGNSYFEIMNLCSNAHYRLALTATPFMRDSEEANMRLMAVSGSVGIEVTEKQLIDSGVIAQPIIKYVRINNAIETKIKRSMNYQRAYELGIMRNERRNKLIIAEALRARAFSLSVMCLVLRQDHGLILQALAEKAGLRSAFIFGDSSPVERANAMKRLESGDLHLLIGSTIMDVGIDLPAIGMVILAGGGKAEVALRQRIGRGLRSKRPELGIPNLALIVDFFDESNNHLLSHSKSRHSICTSTEGFVVLPINDDFDLYQLGYRPRSGSSSAAAASSA